MKKNPDVIQFSNPEKLFQDELEELLESDSLLWDLDFDGLLWNVDYDDESFDDEINSNQEY